MMKTRLMKGRPRLVPPDDYRQASSMNLWIDDKESDITSVSSATSDDSIDSEEDESILSDDEDEMEETGDPDGEETEEDDDDDDDENESAMAETLEPSPTEVTEEKNVAKYNEMTPLFKAIEGAEWDSVVTFLETGSWGWKWSSLCAQLYQVSEKAAPQQVRTWVSAKKKDAKVAVCRLPLHAALANAAPSKVVQVLMKSYSKGAKNPDSEGNYPLHLAFEKAAGIDTMTMLMKEYPEAIHVKNQEGKLPTECGAARGISELVQLCIGATKKDVETDLTKEKGNLEEDRKQLLEVTKELMNLKKIVAERERNMTKENFLYQKQHLNSAISQLTKLKLDLDKHEDNVLKHHLVAEQKRMDGVLGELNKTKGELDKIKSEQNLATPVIESPVVNASNSLTQQKKKKSKKPKKIVTNHHAYPEEEDMDNESPTKYKEMMEPSSPPGSSVWSGQDDSLLTLEPDQPDPEESRDPHEGSPTGRSINEKSSSQSPRKLKNVAARFKKHMNWRKSEKQMPETE